MTARKSRGEERESRGNRGNVKYHKVNEGERKGKVKGRRRMQRIISGRGDKGKYGYKRQGEVKGY